jgi:hypothetical protein
MMHMMVVATAANAFVIESTAPPKFSMGVLLLPLMIMFGI